MTFALTPRAMNALSIAAPGTVLVTGHTPTGTHFLTCEDDAARTNVAALQISDNGDVTRILREPQDDGHGNIYGRVTTLYADLVSQHEEAMRERAAEAIDAAKTEGDQDTDLYVDHIFTGEATFPDPFTASAR